MGSSDAVAAVDAAASAVTNDSPLSPLQRIFIASSSSPSSASSASSARPLPLPRPPTRPRTAASAIASKAAEAVSAPHARVPPSPPALPIPSPCSCVRCLLLSLRSCSASSSLLSHWPPQWREQEPLRRWRRRADWRELALKESPNHHTNTAATVHLHSTPSLLPSPSTALSTVNRALASVSVLHGFLCDRSIPELIAQTNYTRHELFAIFLRFKSLCCLSPHSGPEGIDAETFQRGVVRLSVEDGQFVSRVFALVDTDNSNSIEWEEFLVAMAALEKGSAEIKAKFACQVYDLDGDGFIGRQDLTTMFQASSMLKQAQRPNEEDEALSDEVIAMFVSKVFETFECAESGLISFETVLQFIKSTPSTCDVWDLFGRSMLQESVPSHNHAKHLQQPRIQKNHHQSKKVQRRGSQAVMKPVQMQSTEEAMSPFSLTQALHLQPQPKHPRG